MTFNTDEFLAHLAATGRCWNHLTQSERREAVRLYMGL